MMRRLLDGLYRVAEWAAMAALGLIAVMVLIQVLARMLDSLLRMAGLPAYGFIIPSLAEFAGFLLVAASFLGLAGSLRSGTQIRVTLAIGSLPMALRRPAEIVVLAVAAALTTFFCWYCVMLVLDSYRYGEVSYGIIVVPLWIPQAAMAAGVGVFAIALIDDLVMLLTGGQASYIDHEAAHEGAGE